MGYAHENKKGTTYYLNCKDVTLKSTGRVQRIYYFSKDQEILLAICLLERVLLKMRKQDYHS